MITWNPAALPSAAAGQAISRQVPVVVLDAPADSLALDGVPETVVVGDALFALA